MGRPDQITLITRRLLLVIAVVIALGVAWTAQMYRAQQQFQADVMAMNARLGCAVAVSLSRLPHRAGKPNAKATPRGKNRLNDEDIAAIGGAMTPYGPSSPSPEFLRCVQQHGGVFEGMHPMTASRR
ncbi:MAG: hypothetical protein JWM87_961 [Candidatus Eremiobacteraeota bacterium]|nr:hypothetical protein [Candidatus Eremiobacteraeota bacterium]